jgi:hypothetical protein
MLLRNLHTMDYNINGKRILHNYNLFRLYSGAEVLICF